MDAGRDMTKRERLRLARDYQRRRLVHLECADGYLDIGRRLLRPGTWRVRWAVRVLAKSAAAYQGAGMSRKGQAVWRLARIVHAAAVREAMR
jgi:hypothetical protein